MITKREQLEKRRRMILGGFEIGQLDNPQTAKSIENALTNIDLEMTPPVDNPDDDEDDESDLHPRPEEVYKLV